MEYKSITKSAYFKEGLTALRAAEEVNTEEELRKKLSFNMNSNYSRKTCWGQIKKRYLKDENNRKIKDYPLVRLIDFQENQLNRELMYFSYLHREPIARKTILELIYPRLLKQELYKLTRREIKEFIEKYMSYSEATMIKTASQITRALIDFKMVQVGDKDVEISFYEPRIYSFLYGLYSEYSPGFVPAERFKILNPSFEHIKNNAQFYKLFLIRPSMLRSYLKISWDKNYLAFEPRGGLDQYVLSHETLDGLTDYILNEEE